MWTFGILLLIAGASVAVHEERVVGGTNTPDGAVPYQASLRNSGIHTCGGSIIDKRWVLTAAHCTIKMTPPMIMVIVGSNRLNQGGAAYSVDRFINHESYDSVKIKNDISLIKLTSDIMYGPTVGPISLPNVNTAAGASVTASGWGSFSEGGPTPNDLQWIRLNTISVSECQMRYTGTAKKIYVYDTEICTLTNAGQGMCRGDSGGPLVENGVLVGVTSWVIPCAVGYPDVFTRVWSFKNWISNQIARN